MIVDPPRSPATPSHETSDTAPPRPWHLPGARPGVALCGRSWLDPQQPVRLGDACPDCTALALSGA